ncbi:energy transducer TonB family protein [Pontixanthobacter luteolus]|uniref:energy transducer TonB family protein n=1 Tax=Pontixanthobacter luteolus TaxID=295089 RepID=UPI00136DF52D|nr:energy transducer TonB [Pontixanthobacter luteolus]
MKYSAKGAFLIVEVVISRIIADTIDQRCSGTSKIRDCAPLAGLSWPIIHIKKDDPMQIFTKAVLAAGLAVTATTPVIAAEDQDIIVSSRTALQQWVAKTNHRLDRQLEVTTRLQKLGAPRGIVQIRFDQGENGRPANVEIYRSSGVPLIDRTAAWAVRRMSGLDEVPVAGAAKAKFQANIIFATGPEEKAKYFAQLRQSEKVRLASSPAERAVISLGS